jgi:hypothetical protein
MRVLRWLVFAGVGGAIALNVLAYRQAHTMTAYTVGGARTAGPEHLSLAERAAVLVNGVAVARPVIDATPAGVGVAHE